MIFEFKYKVVGKANVSSHDEMIQLVEQVKISYQADEKAATTRTT